MIDTEFRAWDQEEKVMYYNVENTYDWHGYDGECKCPATCFGEILQDDNFIVMQYTGMRDSKRTEEYPDGQKIFVGDVIGCESNWNEDGYYEEGWKFVVEDIRNILFQLEGADKINVIRNIYQDTELSIRESLDSQKV